MLRFDPLIRSTVWSFVAVSYSLTPALGQVAWTAEAAPIIVYDKNVTSGVPFQKFVADGHEFSVPADQQANPGWVWGGGASLNRDQQISPTTLISSKGAVVARSSSAWERPKIDVFGDACIQYSKSATRAVSTCIFATRSNSNNSTSSAGMSVRYKFRSSISSVEYYPRVSVQREGGRLLLGSDISVLDVPVGGLIGNLDLHLVSRQKSGSTHSITRSIGLTKYTPTPFGNSKIEASVSEASGTKFLGIDRESRIYHAGIIFMPTSGLDIGVGFDKTVARPELFDDSGFGVTVAFNPLKF